ncbi:unnamed protein product [Phyllotreta striolata]|uniref:C2H2-type domain-containing protein n=1 Tax=Phyllotreta striolata TaxID=444603 RepID=A0A9N9TNZ9_PHYSR|nr:unnamed protein product [Phyllotreta striolata]
MSGVCLICLQPKPELINIDKNINDNDSLLTKLMDCIPELDWSKPFELCYACSQQVNEIHSFRLLCISSYKSYWLLRSTQCLIKDEKPSDLELKIELDNNDYADNLASDDGDSNNEAKSKTKKVSCKICGKSYASKYVLKKHTKICLLKHDDGNKNSEAPSIEDFNIPPSCLECGMTFKNKYLQKRHLDNVHIKEKKFICEICNRGFASSVYLNAHKRYHSGERPHVCSFCGKGYITASDLYHHEKIHANKRSYRCEICPKAFNTSSDLYKHKICVHMDRSLWKYACDVCDRKFPLKINMESHRKTHTGERNFPCHLCDRKCINMSVLKRHIQTHSHLFFYKCDVCEQPYKYQKSLDIHKAKAHGIGTIKIRPTVKKFACPLCSKAYSANNKLQKHLRAHVGDKPFKCPECQKGFTDKSYVKQHLKTAHNIPGEDA